MTKLKQKAKKVLEAINKKIKEEILHSISISKKIKLILARFLISKTITTFVFIPILAAPFGIAEQNVSEDNTNKSCIELKNCDINNIEDKKLLETEKIRQYMIDRSMPLADNAADFVNVAYKYGLDYNLLPAIAIRESSGGKNMEFCEYNPFGWASCRVGFKDYKESIETVAKNLSGANKKTSYYYAGKTNKEKLYNYNGTVITGYENEVMNIMNKIDKEEVY